MVVGDPDLRAEASGVFSFVYPAMGTEFTLHLYAPSEEHASAAARTAFEEVERVESLLSHYRPSSELSRINREAPRSSVTTDPETFQFLETAWEWSRRSDGAFDMTVGRLMKAWGFYGADGSLPARKALAQVRDDVGWEKVRLDPARRTVRFLERGIELDPGGIGKGYAVDRAIHLLRQLPVEAALLSAGSSTIYALGAPPDETGWKVTIPAAHRSESVLCSMVLRDTSISTANHTEKHFVDNGRLYGSIMNPRTLRPVEDTIQVCVISTSATESDVLSNALFVMERKQRARLLEQLPHVSALVLAEGRRAWQHEATRWPAEVSLTT